MPILPQRSRLQASTGHDPVAVLRKSLPHFWMSHAADPENPAPRMPTATASTGLPASFYQ